MNSQRRSPPVVTNHQNARAIFNYAEKKMVGKPFEVHPSEIVLTVTEGFGMIGCLLEEQP